MLNLKSLLFVVLLIGLAWPVYWDDAGADMRTCFNINVSGATVYNGVADNTVFLVNTTHASGFNGPYAGYSNGTLFSAFRYANNSTTDMWAVPAKSASSALYCIYSGGSNYSDIAQVSKYFTDGVVMGGFDGACNTNGGLCYPDDYPNLMSYGSPSYYHRELLVSANGTGRIAAYATNYLGADLIHEINRTAAKYKNFYYATAYTDMATDSDLASLRILKLHDNLSVGNSSSWVYHANGSLIASNTTGGHDAILSYGLEHLGVDWAIGYEYTNYSVWNYTSSVASDNITVNSPSSGSTWESSELYSIIYSVNSTFDNCTVSLNNIVQGTTTSPGSGNVILINTSSVLIGANEINVTCFLSGVPESVYLSFTASQTAATDLFYATFNQDISSCPAATMTALSANCTKYFRNEYAYNFSAVICQGLVPANYSCITSFADNITKNGYTMFVTPGWTTPIAGVNAVNREHIGANFIYNGLTISNGIEVIGNYSFIYIPAQTKLKDCGVYYASTAQCSLWSGFVLNDRTVYISNEYNEWFSAAGYGVTSFNANYSNTTVTVSVTPIIQYVQNGSMLNDIGIYTRMSCKQNGSTYSINIRNTLPVVYVLSANGSNPISMTSTNTVFEYTTTLANNTQLVLTGNGKTLCRYGYSDSPLFLPFSIPELNTSFTSIFIKIMFIFSVVISALIPYTLIITVVLNDMFNVMDPQHIAVIMVFGCISALVNAAYQSSRGIKNMVMMLGLMCGFMLAMGTSMTDNGLPDSAPITGMFTGLKAIADHQSIPDMAAGLFTFAISLFVTIMALPVVLVAYIGDLLNFINPNIGAAFAPFSILAVAAVVYLYIKAFEVLGNKFRDV